MEDDVNRHVNLVGTVTKPLLEEEDKRSLICQITLKLPSFCHGHSVRRPGLDAMISFCAFLQNF